MTEAAASHVAPFGSWSSPLAIDLLVRGAVRPLEIQVDGEDVYWLEGRPEEGGRQALVRRRAGRTEDVVGPAMNVRDRVHEYGGGSYVAADGIVVASDWADGRLHRIVEGANPVPLTPPGAHRYADPVLDRIGRRVICVRESHEADGEPVNELVAVPLDGSAVTVLASGADFYAAPRVDPAGGRLAWLEWDHPNMPWDGTRLVVGTLIDADVRDREIVAGADDGEWISQPSWSPGGVLHFVAERSGWMNLYQRADGRDVALAPLEAEFAGPPWVFGLSSYDFLSDGRVVAAARSRGRDLLCLVGPEPGIIETIELPYTEIAWLRAAGEAVLFVGAAPDRTPEVVRLGLADRAVEVLRRSTPIGLDPAIVSRPELIEFPTDGGRTAFGLFYPPRNPGHAAPAGEKPPLVVTSHGGPTSRASTALSIGVQLLTSRGIAVLDVDYGGSTGYGREYRRRLEGAWGVVDVADCANGARWLAERGVVDPERLAIRGGSASGYTTLCALAYRDDFRAGISYYGIGDLETFVAQTHKFESRYLDRLLGPYPAARETYRARSPLNHLDGMTAPALIIQGLDDRIVPPAQAEQIVDGLRRRGVPHAYLAFEGEDHGFRRSASIIRSFEAELSFLGQVFGFTPADPIEPLLLEGTD